MKNRMTKWMQGRYGYDPLTKFFAVLTLILMFIEIFYRNPIVFGITFVVYIYMCIYRPFSKKISARRNELMLYMRFTEPIRKILRTSKIIAKNSKTKKYFRCPNCRGFLKVPREKGKIKITCPYCHHQFIKKT